jgi:hypoxanthine phosphoribosyltransferase
MDEKIYLTAQDLLIDSYELGMRIFKSGFKPSFIVGVWRGGTPVGIAVQEILDHLGLKTDHIAIRTSSYYGIDKREKIVRVHGLEYVVRNANWEFLHP